MHCESKVGYYYWEFDCIFLFLTAFVSILIHTLIFSPWLLFRKVIITQLELGTPVLQQALSFTASLQSRSQANKAPSPQEFYWAKNHTCKPWKEWTRLDYMSDLTSGSNRRIKREAIDKKMRWIWTHQIFKTFNVLRKANKQMYTQTKTKLPRKRTVKNTICFDSLCRNPVLQWTVLRTFLRKECM